MRVLHLCRPAYDNLGEAAAIASVEPMFARQGVAIERTALDLWDAPDARMLDGRGDEIAERADLVLIGPGGFLGPRLIDRVFADPAGWSRLKTPIAFAGAGVVASIGRPVWYAALDQGAPVMRALAAAAAVGVREAGSWLLAARALGDRQDRLTLAGCPSIPTARAEPAPAKTHDLALELPFTHEVCRNHVAAMLDLARAVRATGRSVRWVCHSQLDEEQAVGVNARLGLGFDVIRPRDAAEAGLAYGACRAGLVTRFHAGLFCLAGDVPFGMVGYDVKCWRLMAMLADEPHAYVLAIDRLAAMDLGAEVPALLERLARGATSFATAEALLRGYFERETDRFVARVLAAV